MSELIPEFWFDELHSYTVKVSVTNVGDEPLGVVYIFLFPYKNDEFAETWGVYYFTHSVEDLYIGETHSYEFTAISKEMTTYKVLAVAG